MVPAHAPEEAVGREGLGVDQVLVELVGRVTEASTITGARIAIRISRTTMTPPAIATRSRRRRVQAIWPSERPRTGMATRVVAAVVVSGPGTISGSLGRSDYHSATVR